jgi:hypothetical protein
MKMWYVAFIEVDTIVVVDAVVDDVVLVVIVVFGSCYNYNYQSYVFLTVSMLS